MKTKKVAALSAAAVVAAGAAFIPASFADGMITVSGLEKPIPAVNSTVRVESTALIDAGAATLDGKPLTCDTSGLKNNDYTTTCRYLDGDTPVATITFVTKGSPDDVTEAVTPAVKSVTVDGTAISFDKRADGYYSTTTTPVVDPANAVIKADVVGGAWTDFGGSDSDRLFAFTPEGGEAQWYHIALSQKPVVASVTVDGEAVTFADVNGEPTATVEVVDPANIDVEAVVKGGTWTESGGGDADHVYLFTPADGSAPVHYHIRTIKKAALSSDKSWFSVVIPGVDKQFTPADFTETTDVAGFTKHVAEPIVVDDLSVIPDEIESFSGATGSATTTFVPLGSTSDQDSKTVYFGVKAEDGSVDEYVVTFKLAEQAPSSVKSFTSLTIGGSPKTFTPEDFTKATDPAGFPVYTAKESVEVEDLAAVDATVLGGSTPAGVQILPGGESVAADGSSKTVRVLLVAEDGSQDQYEVTFTQKAKDEPATPSSQAWITNIVVDGYSVMREDFKPSTEDSNVHNLVTIEVEDLDAITGAVESISGMGTLPEASSASVEGVNTAGKQHKAYTYTVTAEDGSQADYVIDFVQKDKKVDPEPEPGTDDNNGATEEPGVDETKPADEGKADEGEAESGEKSLAKTGVAVGGLAGLAALLSGSGIFAVRRSRRED